jgi:DNA helicase-2/ATP-dependent DNA helicase PcrA
MEIIEGLNDRQKEAVLTADGPCLVIAGAGSRKNKSINSQNSIYYRKKKYCTMEYTCNNIYK